VPGGASIDGTEIDQLPELPSASKPVADTPLTGQALASFLRGVFNDIQTTWADEFKAAGATYRPARLVLFTSVTNTSCGVEKAETGPFYCPADSTVYLDQSFFTAMEQQFGVAGDFAPAYVVAHEVGHHIQSLLGITGRVGAAGQSDPAATNAISVDVELQADCFAGVWAHSTDQRNLLEDGDLAEALKAAAAVGDDFISQVSGRPVAPEEWTHGSSSQRQHWLTVGFEKGTPDACDTFSN
jgi:predicted metalloprotease